MHLLLTQRVMAKWSAPMWRYYKGLRPQPSIGSVVVAKTGWTKCLSTVVLTDHGHEINQ
jgi:hypothetical protein